MFKDELQAVGLRWVEPMLIKSGLLKGVQDRVGWRTKLAQDDIHSEKYNRLYDDNES